MNVETATNDWPCVACVATETIHIAVYLASLLVLFTLATTPPTRNSSGYSQRPKHNGTVEPGDPICPTKGRWCSQSSLRLSELSLGRSDDKYDCNPLLSIYCAAFANLIERAKRTQSALHHHAFGLWIHVLALLWQIVG